MTALDQYDLEFTSDPSSFVDACGSYLADQPVLNTVVAANAHGAVAAAQAGVGLPGWAWYLVVRDRTSAEIAGVAMRTAPFEPRPGYLLPMPDDAARLVARTLHARDESLTAVNGAIGAARAYGAELARMTGAEVAVRQHTRLFELTEVITPRPVPGQLRAARPEENALCRRWHAAFVRDADEQAGRPPGPEHPLSEGEVARRIEGRRLWLWTDDKDRPVHLTGTNVPSFGSTRLGPVYTPKEHRGRGYASAAVAEVSRHILAAGSRPCLFTDQANPTSNAVYLALGYRPVVDMINIAVVPAAPAT